MTLCKGEECKHGFVRCCVDCPLRESCNAACEDAGKACADAVSDDAQDRPSNRKQGETLWKGLLTILLAAAVATSIVGVVHVDRTCGRFVAIAQDLSDEQHALGDHMDAIDQWLIDQEKENLAKEQMAACLKVSPPAEELDLELLARVVAAEARGESLEGQMAVAQVIKDRSDLWGESPESIVLAPAQFADPYEGEIPETTWDAVEAVFLSGERVFHDPVTHFYAYELCSPYWAETKVSRGVIGGHEFMF